MAALWFGHPLDHRRAITIRSQREQGDTLGWTTTLGRCCIRWNELLYSEQSVAVTALAGPLAEQRGSGGSYRYGDDDDVLGAAGR